jgi:hypothetical protein
VKHFLDSFAPRREACALRVGGGTDGRSPGPSGGRRRQSPRLGTKGSHPVGDFRPSLNHVLASELVAASIPGADKRLARHPRIALRRELQSSPGTGIACLLL